MRRPMVSAWTRSARWGALLAAASTLACSPAQKAEPGPPPDAFAATSPYGRTCAELSGQRDAETKGGKYHPSSVLLHRWTGVHDAKTPKRVDERELHGLLADGSARTVLMLARGGSGKSKLAWSLEGALCGRMPVVRVDLQWDVAEAEQPVPEGENGVLVAAARRLGADADASTRWLADRLRDRPWLMLLDSLDEVALQRRLSLVDQINAAQARFPGLRVVVFSRPPVFSGSYGLRTIDAVTELPQLDCARTDAAIAELVPDAERRRALLTLLQRYGLDRKARTPDGRCYYPHVSTYRDFFVIEKIAQNFSTAGAQLPDQLEPSRARVYGFYLEVSLIKDMQGVPVTPKAAIELVDELISRSKPTAGTRNLYFSVAQCLEVAPGKTDDERKAVCERLLQSSLFETAPHAEDRWRLKNQSIYDYFLARHTDRAIQAEGGGCRIVDERSALLESNEVAGFLVGFGGGQRCLLPIVRQLCKAGGFAQHNFEQLDQGLPAGPGRKKLLDDAVRGMGEMLQPHLCVGATIDRLYKVGGETADPGDTPAPPRPGQ